MILSKILVISIFHQEFKAKKAKIQTFTNVEIMVIREAFGVRKPFFAF